MVKLTKRMEAAASMVTKGNRLADVGTDHGYIPIALVQRNIIPSAIAMDINAGPLQRATDNIRRNGLSDRIDTRKCDGVAALAPGEVDTVLIAGMGGELMIHILREGEAVIRQLKELVLQPQSDIHKVRKYLREQGYRIVDEDMILEDGKYYPMMRVIPVEDLTFWQKVDELVVKTCDIYGPILLKNGHPILRRYLVQEHKLLLSILEGLECQEPTENIRNRRVEIHEKLSYNESAYTILGDLVNAGI